MSGDVLRDSGTASRDETTRLLCAAAHRHERFACDIVRIYLAEKVGAVPPSPGLDAAAAMRDAVAAQSRRFGRDVLVLLLLVLLFVLAPLATLIWLVGIVLIHRKVKPAVRAHGRWMAVVGTLAVLALIGAVQALPFTHLLLPSPGWWPAVVVAGLIFLALAAERYAGEVYLRSRFQPTTFVADPTAADSGVERWLRKLGGRRFGPQLLRVAEADEYHPAGQGMIDVIVHHTPTPFLGAGYQVHTEPVVVAAKGRKAEPIDVTDLHQHLARKLLADPAATGKLLYRRQIVVAAEQLGRLVHAGDTPFARMIFDRKRPPTRHLPPSTLDEVVSEGVEGVEGVRFYGCFRTESFRRRVVVSCYLRVISYGNMIHLRLTPCVLPPVNPWLDEVDYKVRLGYGWLNEAALDFLALPRFAYSRLVAVLNRPTPRGPRGKKIQPERYGAGRSLREEVSRKVAEEHWYQNDDASGTMSMLSRLIFDEAATYLKKRGYDVSQLRKDAETVVKNYSIKINGGQFTDVNIATGNINQGADGSAKDKGKDKSADKAT